MLIASYDLSLVVISLLVAILASYTALDMAARIATTKGMTSLWWLAGGALAMGVGIWSMHFVGMLAFRLPIPLGYDLSITLISLVIAIAVSGFALWQVRQATLPIKRHLAASLIMGSGIAAMHYTGMAAMRMDPGISYNTVLFSASLLIAVTASGAALWIAFKLRKSTSNIVLTRMAAAIVMGIAIVGMHYTGMAASEFPFGSVCTVAAKADSVDSLAIMVVMGTVSVLVIALLCSILDARLESRTAMLAKSLETANHELMLQALHDNLTKLPNRTLLEDRVTQAIHKAKRVNASFALMFIDLDGFKAVNDSLGHHIGDLLLIEMASRIRSTLRQHDTVARLGGDEFVVLVEPARPEDAAIIAEKIIGVVNQPFTASSHQLKVSASIGISVYPIDGKTYRDLAINADAAMYHTKRAGRNGFHFFEASMNIDAANQLNLMLDLGHALEQKQLKLFYQPKFRASSGELIGAEALLRWQHPTRGMIPPDQFIPLAEKSGLIIPIGDWVLNEACQQMREWHDAGHTHLKVAVNLSPQQFNHQDLVQMVQNTLLNHHLPSSCLILEITESTAMHNVKASLEILQQIADLGVDISIDDFGTGYSSLLYLKRLPANELKIDRGFINNLSIDPDDAAIVSAIIALGHTLNLRIVAEGVETTFQQSYLMELGCDTLQGYLLGKPMPAGQLSEYLLNATAAVPLAS
jgi:diguanylate cyclase (GGDEF)-like protein